MKLLLITHKPPAPVLDGGGVAVASFLSLIHQSKHEVRTICIATKKHPYDSKKLAVKIPPSSVESQFVNSDASKISMFLASFKNIPLLYYRFYCKQMTKRIKAAAAEANIIILDGAPSLAYFYVAKQTGLKVFYRSHNIEADIWRSKANSAGSIKKPFYKVIANSVAKFEQNVIPKLNGVFAISSSDQTAFKSKLKQPNVEVIYPEIEAINCIKEQIENTTGPLKFGLIGNFSWGPNLESLLFVVNKIIPELKKSSLGQQIEIIVAGTLPDQFDTSLITSLGRVELVADFYRQIDVALIPTFSGSGVRIKAMEAMAYCIPIIATPLGMQGLDAKPGVHFLEANSVEAFLKSINQVIAKKTRSSIAQSGFEHLQKITNNEIQLSKLDKVLTT